MEAHENLTTAVAARCSERPDEIAVITVGERETEPDHRLGYGTLDRMARVLAVWLQRNGCAGRPVLVSMDTGPHLVVAVLGCLYAGAVVAAVPPPSSSRAATERTAAIVQETGATVVLTVSGLAADVSRQLAGAGRGGGSGPVCLAVDVLVEPATPEQAERAAADAAAWRAPELDGESPALIQYTSGTTAAPRGVVVTHANLLATMVAIQEALGTHPGSRIGGWLPLHHDLGMVGQLLHPLWLGATAVLMRPWQVLLRPLRWLAAVDHYGITVTAAPDSAYARCLAEATDADLDGLDLSRLEAAVNAAEPVSPLTMSAFARRFARAGLRPETLSPGYGLAEATLLVSVASGAESGVLAEIHTVDAAALDGGRLERPTPGAPVRTLVGCGRPRGVEVRIVDPDTRRELPEGSVGEIWVRGPAVASGYWKRPLERAEVFRQATAEGEPGFLRTGDLGALHGGSLFVTGRLKDVLLIGGRALHPQEVERRLADCGPQFVSAAVFAVQDGRDHVVAVQEVRSSAHTTEELVGLAARVHDCLEQDFGATAAGVLLVRPGTVRRTTSGKIRRSFMRELLVRGELRSLHAELTPELQNVLAATGGRTEGSP